MPRNQHDMERLLQDLKSADWETRFKATEVLGKLTAFEGGKASDRGA